MPRSVENSVSPPAEPLPLPLPASVSGLTVRNMELPDVTEVADLEARVFPDPWSSDSFLSELERRPEIGYPIVARDRGGRLVAYAVVWFIVDETHIGNIAVDPDWQGHGLGRPGLITGGRLVGGTVITG